ncbi:MAG: hypothetical protein DRN15_05895 [Thermoprotei archaeon]|nr:MAG: hypothetical protein DRN15_05895 [Thermoprotei archaeon]RLF23695.1 MAG: hypothetical protein DRM97_04420 [Thermoprotei archaeon]
MPQVVVSEIIMSGTAIVIMILLTSYSHSLSQILMKSAAEARLEEIAKSIELEVQEVVDVALSSSCRPCLVYKLLSIPKYVCDKGYYVEVRAQGQVLILHLATIDEVWKTELEATVPGAILVTSGTFDGVQAVERVYSGMKNVVVWCMVNATGVYYGLGVLRG